MKRDNPTEKISISGESQKKTSKTWRLVLLTIGIVIGSAVWLHRSLRAQQQGIENYIAKKEKKAALERKFYQHDQAAGIILFGTLNLVASTSMVLLTKTPITPIVIGGIGLLAYLVCS